MNLLLLLISVAPLLALVCCNGEKRALHIAAAQHDHDASLLEPTQQGAAGRIYGYDEGAHAVGRGKELFDEFNCVGCHAHGGGGIGPALIDNRWIYGGAAAQIHQSIAAGRPNGMPAFGGKIPDYEIWQLTAYVRSLSARYGKRTRRIAKATAADETRASEDAKLNSHGWIDTERGIVRIPIERAMDLVAQRGLPARGPGTQNSSGKTPEQMRQEKAAVTKR